MNKTASMTNILVLGAGEAQIPIIKKCKSLDIYTLVVDYNKDAKGLMYADKIILKSTLDSDGILNEIENIKIDGIVTTSDFPVRTQAFLCKKLNLDSLSVHSANLCTDKYMFRNFLRENGFKYPNYWKFTELNEVEYVRNQLTFPLIIKPVDSSASRGVKLIKEYNELKPAFLLAKEYSVSKCVLLEEYLIGPEYSIEVLISNNKTHIVSITEKTINNARIGFFVEDRHIIPAKISDGTKDIIIKEINLLVKKLSLTNCSAHIEVKLTNKGLVIIELGPRLGGDYIASDLVPLSTGIDMLENVINISLGRKINYHKNKDKFSGVQFINSDNYTSVRNHLDKIKDDKGLVRYEIKEFKKVILKNSLNRLGYYICVADSREKLLKLLNYN